MTRDSFIMYNSFYEPIQDLGDAQMGQLLKAIFADRRGEPSESHLADPSVRMAFRFIAEQFKRDDAKYEEVVLSRREAGKAGAVKRWQKMAKDSKNSKCHSAMANDGKNALYVNDNVDDNKEKSLEKKVAAAPSPSRFARPSLEEVEDYARTMGYVGFNAQHFWSYYESNGWKVGRNPMKDWKAAVRSWNAKDRGAGYGDRHPIGDFSNEYTTI